MKRLLLAGGAALALSGPLVMAQDAPESLLPPGFNDPVPTPTARPAPRPTSAPAPTATPTPAQPGSTPVVQPVPGAAVGEPIGPVEMPANLPSLEQLEAMNPDELDQLLGLKPKYDIPPAARRSMAEIGLLAASEGGFPAASLGEQPASLVKAAIEGIKGPLVSRWGHILLRRVLASRLEAPAGMDPVDFAAMRIALLDRLGEFSVARGVAQDVDTANWNPALTDAALVAYLGTTDVTGACPAVRLQGGVRNDAEWTMLQAICAAYAGEGARGSRELDRAMAAKTAPQIDVLLAQRYAGAAGTGRRAVNIEWDGVEDITPWRFALATALGIDVPDGLKGGNARYYQLVSALAPELSISKRIPAARTAARDGVMSASAMVDLYGQSYGAEDMPAEEAAIAGKLRDAYVSPDPAARMAAIREIWGDSDNPPYDRQVLTAYAAARMPASGDYLDDAAPLIASMLAAGLDKDALSWGRFVPEGTQAWGLLILAQPSRSSNVDSGALDNFVSDDASTGQRKSAFLIAGLAGLGRASQGDVDRISKKLGMQLDKRTRWSDLIDRAAQVNNPALVALLSGVGMQGTDWSQMTPRHLYHIVAALNRVGLTAEARMIAAEAVARG